MAKKKRDDYNPCSERDTRSAGLRATHDKLREMDEQGKPTVGMFGRVEKQEKAKLRALGYHMVKKDTCRSMTWNEIRDAANKFAEE